MALPSSAMVTRHFTLVPKRDSEISRWRRLRNPIAATSGRSASTLITSQLPVSRWHGQIGDPTLVDGILDRLVYNTHRIECVDVPRLLSFTGCRR